MKLSFGKAKADVGLTKVYFELKWGSRDENSCDLDLDISAILLGVDGQVRSNEDFVYFNQLGDVTVDGKNFHPKKASVKHLGDKFSVAGGDSVKEKITVDLTKIPADVDKILFVVSINDVAARKQTFKNASWSEACVVNEKTKTDLALMEYFGSELGEVSSVIFSELYRENGFWHSKVISHTSSNSLEEIARQFGATV